MLTNATATVGASIGIAVAEPGITATDLTRRADIAMYSAKTAGRNRIEAYQPTAPTRTGNHRRVDDQQPAA